MLKSMTGFGRSKVENQGRTYTVEIKSVNHKYLDISVKLPRSISYLEERAKKTIANCTARGKIDVFVNFQNDSNIGKNVVINKELAKAYIQQLASLAEETGVIDDISIMNVAKLPDVLDLQGSDDEELLGKELEQALLLALETYNQAREIEGVKLAEDLAKRIDKIEEKIKQISHYSTGLIEDYVVKLEERIKELLKTDIIEQSRLAQEVVIYADKCSIEEEITRLGSHIMQFRELLNNSENKPVGKTIDFLIQEMNRETNTIASKANCLDITKGVIEVKTELENIREQIQNIE